VVTGSPRRDFDREERFDVILTHLSKISFGFRFSPHILKFEYEPNFDRYYRNSQNLVIPVRSDIGSHIDIWILGGGGSVP
jgi:hypothetical protein